MIRQLFCLSVVLLLFWTTVSAEAGNPFLVRENLHSAWSQQLPQASFLRKIAFWQQQLKEKMTGLLRKTKTADNMILLPTALLMIAFLYGALHAAGPGHGKVAAVSFVLSRKTSVVNGLLFGILIAFCHGFSGVICVLGLYYIIQKGAYGAWGSVFHFTQIVSYSLIAALGLGMLVKNAISWRSKSTIRPGRSANEVKDAKKALVSWAVAVGLVPCPGVVMTVLFCLSLDALVLGLWLAFFISLGMATTISLVVVSSVFAKGAFVNTVADNRSATVENIIGIIAGFIITALGLVSLAATLS